VRDFERGRTVPKDKVTERRKFGRNWLLVDTLRRRGRKWDRQARSMELEQAMLLEVVCP
jgi:hypothetical protein